MIKPIQYYKDKSLLTFQKRINYAPNCYIERTSRKFRNKEYLVSSNYMDNSLISTLIYVKKAGDWIKSKLKYFRNGKCYMIVRSQNDRMV